MMTSTLPTTHPSNLIASANLPLSALSVERLAEHSLREGRRSEGDNRYAYELFRRALVEGDQQAWAAIYTQYARLVEHWVRRTGAYHGSGEGSEAFVGAAFTRFWRAIGPERFAAFPTLPALLNYLRRCATCVVIDSARARSVGETVADDELFDRIESGESVEDDVAERMDRGEFWQQIMKLLPDETERALVYASFALGMRPAELLSARPDLFDSVETIYTLKRNILARLRRSPELRQLYR